MTVLRIEKAEIDTWVARVSDRIDPNNRGWITALCREWRTVLGGALQGRGLDACQHAIGG